jgi:Xaa-Pro aminopeptidase
MFEAHFQSFDDRTDAGAAAERVKALRTELSARRLDGFVVPRTDRFQNEYVPPSDERLAWLTGFSGSAGLAIILADRAVLFVDGRYQVQAREEADGAVFTFEHLVENPPPAWIKANLSAGARLGYSPWLHTVEGAERLGKACGEANATLVAVDDNPIDAIWTDRPEPPLGPVVAHDMRYAGETVADKLARVRAELAKDKADTLIVSDPHAVSWLFNIRGSDVPHTPVVLAFATVPREGRPSLFVDLRKIGNDMRARLEEIADVRLNAAFERDLAGLGREQRVVRLDPATCPEAIAQLVAENGGAVARGSDPIVPMKAVKNAAEIEGARASQLRDGVAVTRFLAWFDRAAARGDLTEIAAVEAMETFRRETGLLKDISFPTIAGAGPDGAIVHYRVTRKTNRQIEANDLFLLDSGGQYEDGTTDITRTVAVGAPSAEIRRNFTLVLKGHIAIARAVFPDGTSGAQLDSFARQFLWRAGLDFDHGTGHGVGCYLSVHEGPGRIAKLGAAPLKRGMILSNEPGYYRAGAYGIRIENLVLVTEAAGISGAERPFNAFETLTLAPIDARLVDPAMLTPDERYWFDRYQARVRETLAPHLETTARAWLFAATIPPPRGA